MFWIYQMFDIHKVISIDGYDMLIAPLPKLTFPKVFKIKNYEIIKLQNIQSINYYACHVSHNLKCPL